PLIGGTPNISSSGFALDVTDANTERFVREALAKVREHLREARYWDAIAEVERALGDAPDNAELQETLTVARELRAKQRAQEAVVRARVLLEAAKYDEAIAVLEQVMAAAP